MSPRPALSMFLFLCLASLGCRANSAPPAHPHGDHDHHAGGDHDHHAGGDHDHHAGGDHDHHAGGDHDHHAGGQCKHADGESCQHHAPHAAAPDHQHGGGMPHRFDDAEKWAKVFDDPARDEWQRPDEVVAALDLRPGMAVADVGAGTGYFLGRLVAKVGPGGKVLATDIEPDMVRHLEARAKGQGWANVTAVLGKPDDSGLAAASVDRILIVDVWHHLGDRRAYAAKLAAALRPGGKLAVVDFELDSRRGPPREHRLAATVIAEELRAAGFTVSMATENLPDQYIVLATR